jgi:6-phosphogluconolactonase (cycloisomerase 2 family)
VIVADLLNERIVVLNEDLQLKRVLINSSHGQQPMRLCLSQRTGLLFIAMYQSSDIHVYDVLQQGRL